MLTRRRQNPWTRWISIWFACVFAGGGGHVGWTSTPVTFTRLRTYNQPLPTPPHTHTLLIASVMSDVLHSLNKIFYIHNKV